MHGDFPRGSTKPPCSASRPTRAPCCTVSERPCPPQCIGKQATVLRRVRRRTSCRSLFLLANRGAARRGAALPLFGDTTMSDIVLDRDEAIEAFLADLPADPPQGSGFTIRIQPGHDLGPTYQARAGDVPCGRYAYAPRHLAFRQWRGRYHCPRAGLGC
jgi:hypothetical protein